MVKFIKQCLIALSLLSVIPAQAALFNTPLNGQFKSVDNAFAFDFQQQGDQIVLSWAIAPGYYLYRQQLHITPQSAQLGNYQLPDGLPHHDEFYGDVKIFKQQLQLTLPIKTAQQNGQLLVSYQGCAEAGFCYPPQTQIVPLNPVMAQTSSAATVEPGTAAPLQKSVTPSAMTLPFSLLGALLIGIGVAFTPCVLPMFPLIAAILAGGGQRTWRQSFLLAFCYIQGMALTYSVIGVVVALLGLQFQAALQSPYLLIAVSVLFIFLALAMFGVFNIQLPGRWQAILAQWSNQQRAGSYGGVFLMGAIAGLICSPCTTAPLTAILLYIAQTGNLVAGGVTLYLYALGMGIPLLLIALFGDHLLPRRGPWMEYVKEGFGFIILALPIFLLQRIVGDNWGERLWSLWAVGIAIWLFVLSLSGRRGWQRLLQGLFLLAAVIFARPLQDWLFSSNNTSTVSTATARAALPFTQIKSVAQLEQQLQTAQKPIMVDLYAQWCVACKEFEKYTFSDPRVQQALSHYQLLQIDATQMGAEQKAMLDKLQIVGLPTLVFFDKTGQEITNSRVTGYLDAKQFLAHLESLKQ